MLSFCNNDNYGFRGIYFAKYSPPGGKYGWWVKKLKMKKEGEKEGGKEGEKGNFVLIGSEMSPLQPSQYTPHFGVKMIFRRCGGNDQILLYIPLYGLFFLFNFNNPEDRDITGLSGYYRLEGHRKLLITNNE